MKKKNKETKQEIVVAEMNNAVFFAGEDGRVFKVNCDKKNERPFLCYLPHARSRSQPRLLPFCLLEEEPS